MSRSLRSWLCMLAVVFAPTFGFALPPGGAQLKNSVGLQARCPLADGTWQLDQILSQMSATPKNEAPTLGLETHDMVQLPAEPQLAKLEGEIVEPEIVEPECFDTANSTVAVAPPQTKSMQPMFEEYLPYDLRSDDCVRYQASPSASWVRYRSHAPRLINAEPIKIVTRSQPCMVIDTDDSNRGDSMDSSDAQQKAAYLLSLWQHGTLQRDARWILNQSVAKYIEQIEQLSHLGIYSTSHPATQNFDLNHAIALAADELPAVCTPPSQILLAPSVPSENSIEAESQQLVGSPPSWDQIAELSLNVAASKLENAANILRQTSQVLKRNSQLARHASTESERR